MKEELIRRAADYVLVHGLLDGSIREIAKHIGTSHRMINYHFGSSEGFWEALVNEIRNIEIERSRTYFETQDASSLNTVSKGWAYFSTPEYQQIFKLIFELYVKTLRAPQEHEAFARTFVDNWITLLSERISSDFQLPSEESQSFARLRLACIRGLMLDLLLTHESEGIAKAVALYDAMFANYLKHR